MEGRAEAAGLVLQYDHDSTGWTLQGKGPRGDELVLLGMEGQKTGPRSQGWRQSWPRRSCIPQEGPYSPAPS